MNTTIRNKLREIFNRHDPMAIYFGKDINFDEYDSEINLVFPAFKKSKNQKEFTNELYIIFQEMFNNDAGPKSRYKNLTKEAYLFLKNN